MTDFDQWRRDVLEAGHAWARDEPTARSVFASMTPTAPSKPAERDDLAQRVSKLEGALLDVVRLTRRDLVDLHDHLNDARKALGLPIVKRRVRVPAKIGRTW